jgi:peptidoglycan biosynthesis protein MviN/MurJ (putative lipid II flippase)
VQSISSQVLNSFEKFGNGIVGPASSALLMISVFSESSIEKNSIILFLSIGVLRKLGRLARFTIIFPAKFSSDNIEIFESLILTVTGR